MTMSFAVQKFLYGCEQKGGKKPIWIELKHFEGHILSYEDI